MYGRLEAPVGLAGRVCYCAAGGGALVVTAAFTLRINPILDDFAVDLPGKPCVMNTKGYTFREVSAK